VEDFNWVWIHSSTFTHKTHTIFKQIARIIFSEVFSS
jgi:hypothetical protein